MFLRNITSHSQGSLNSIGTHLAFRLLAIRINIQRLRDQISLVSQMPVLFPLTIFENIAAGKENATMQEVIRAAQLVCCLDEQRKLKKQTRLFFLG